MPVWNELMDPRQRELYGERDAAVALRHPDGRPCAGKSWPSTTSCRHFCWPGAAEGIEGETFLIAMTDPFDYAEAARYVAARLGIDVIDLVDPIGHDFTSTPQSPRATRIFDPNSTSTN